MWRGGDGRGAAAQAKRLMAWAAFRWQLSGKLVTGQGQASDPTQSLELTSTLPTVSKTRPSTKRQASCRSWGTATERSGRRCRGLLARNACTREFGRPRNGERNWPGTHHDWEHRQLRCVGQRCNLRWAGRDHGARTPVWGSLLPQLLPGSGVVGNVRARELPEASSRCWGRSQPPRRWLTTKAIELALDSRDSKKSNPNLRSRHTREGEASDPVEAQWSCRCYCAGSRAVPGKLFSPSPPAGFDSAVDARALASLVEHDPRGLPATAARTGGRWACNSPLPKTWTHGRAGDCSAQQLSHAIPRGP